jgi:hypothetical protein
MEAIVLNDTTYAGSVASYMITRAVVGADTIQKGCVYVKDGIKKKETIPRLEVTDFIQRRKATPTSKGTVTVDAKVLEPLDFMLYYEFNPRDFEAHWYAEQQSPSLLARQLPQTIEAFMMMQQMLRLNEWFENAIWRSRIQYAPDGATVVTPASKGAEAGDAVYYYFDGLLKRLLDDATTILVSTPATLVSGTAGGGEENIGAALNRCLKLVPKALLQRYGKMGLKFMISYATKLVYDEFLTTTTTFKNNDTTERSIDRYKGYDVVPLAGMTDNTIVVCIAAPDISSNLWVGINSTSDNTLKLAALQANSEMYFMKGLFKMDTQSGFPDQVVLYTSITA